MDSITETHDMFIFIVIGNTYHDQNREFACVRNISEREANLTKLNLKYVLKWWWSVSTKYWTQRFKLLISYKIELESFKSMLVCLIET